MKMLAARALLLLLLSAQTSGCGSYGSQMFVPGFDKTRLPSFRTLSIEPVQMPARGMGLMSKEIEGDETITDRLREAVVLELVERQAHYSVQILDAAAGEADVRLKCRITPRYKSGPLEVLTMATGKGGSRLQDGSFSVNWDVVDANGWRIWGEESCTARHASSSVEDFRRTVGAKIAASLPFRK